MPISKQDRARFTKILEVMNGLADKDETPIDSLKMVMGSVVLTASKRQEMVAIEHALDVAHYAPDLVEDYLDLARRYHFMLELLDRMEERNVELVQQVLDYHLHPDELSGGDMNTDTP